jgi:2-C-methyl-D-erythritol 4-phosphate cytidylyltransferase
MDLAVLYSGHWSIIEIKLVHPGDGRTTTVTEGLEQVIRYRDTIDRSADAWLVVFDRTPAGRQKTWEERLSWELRETAGGSVTVVGG